MRVPESTKTNFKWSSGGPFFAGTITVNPGNASTSYIGMFGNSVPDEVYMISAEGMIEGDTDLSSSTIETIKNAVESLVGMRIENVIAISPPAEAGVPIADFDSYVDLSA